MRLWQAGAEAVEETCHVNRSLNPNLLTPRRIYVAVNYPDCNYTGASIVTKHEGRRNCPHHHGLNTDSREDDSFTVIRKVVYDPVMKTWWTDLDVKQNSSPQSTGAPRIRGEWFLFYKRKPTASVSAAAHWYLFMSRIYERVGGRLHRIETMGMRLSEC